MTGVAAIALCAAFTSCSKSGDDVYNPNAKEEFKKADFQTTFINTFGQPAADQDWGFDAIQVYDYTQHVSTRAHNVNGNLWYQSWERPVNVTDAEKTKVLAEFSKVRENAQHTENLPWNNYWVQQVHQGTQPSVDGTGAKVFPSEVMNQLMAWNYNTSEYEHVNNFNNANNNTEYTDDETHQKYIGTTLMVDMGTGDVDNQFAYHNTSSSNYYYDYIILQIDGAYYVGFDIVGYHPIGQDANANMDVNRDWIFNDWIVKISPAKFNMNGATRIIAEDLGKDEDSDFDYNDVVFDVKIANEWDGSLNQNRLRAYIRLQAAGGTLPLTIAGREVHALFGVDTNVMVNTRKNTTSRPAVDFKIDLGIADYNISGGDAAKSIPVVVNNSVTLAVETGKAPEKIAVPNTYSWCSERDPIQKVYPMFADWVLDKSVKWYNN